MLPGELGESGYDMTVVEFDHSKIAERGRSWVRGMVDEWLARCCLGVVERDMASPDAGFPADPRGLKFNSVGATKNLVRIVTETQSGVKSSSPRSSSSAATSSSVNSSASGSLRS